MKFDIRKGDTLQSSTKPVGSHAERLFKREITPVRKRADDGTAVIDLSDQVTYYAIDLSIGGLDFDVILDTGSSDLWVFGSNNPYCDTTTGSKEKVLKPDIGQLLNKEKVLKPDTAALLARDVNRFSNLKLLSPFKKRAGDDTTATVDISAAADTPIQTGARTANPEADEPVSIPASLATIDCAAFGTLDSSSDAFSATDDLFLLQYGDTTFALGLYGTGDVKFGETTVKDLTFAVANRSNSTVSVCGVGLAGNEASTQDGMVEHSPNGPFQYDNLPLALKKQGTITSAVYSLFMDETSSEGTILFGGVDHAKYSGDLTTLKLVNYYESYGISSPITFDIELQAATISADSDSADVLTQSISVLLDSGTSFSYLPSSMVQSIMTNLGAQYDYSYGYYLVNCPTSVSGIEINFDFGDVTISVPIEGSLIPVDETYETCAVVLLPSDDRYILGDTFLRSAYVVFDLDNLEVQLAQYKSTTDSDIEVIGWKGVSGGNASKSSATSESSSSSRDSSRTASGSSVRVTSGFASASATRSSVSATATNGSSDTSTAAASNSSGGASAIGDDASASDDAAGATETASAGSSSTNGGNRFGSLSTIPALIAAALLALV